jgi:integrase
MATHYEYFGSWYIQWSEKAGEKAKRHKHCLGRTSVVTEREAKLAAKAKEIELETGKVLFSTVPTLSEFKTEYLKWYEKEYPSSYFRVEQIVEQYLEPEFGHLPMDQIKIKLAEDYKHKRRDDEAKTGTVIKELRTLKAMLNRALDWEILDIMPLRKLKEPQELDSKPPLFYTKKELGKIYECAGDYRWVWQLLANSGLRRSEAMQLKPVDIHKKFIRVLSTEDERTKSTKYRDVPLTANAVKALKKIDGEGGYVLPRIRKESLSRAAIKTIGRAELKGSIHTFRHTYCSHLIMNGVPIRTAQKLLGHAKIETTEKYAHLAPAHVSKMGLAINL